MTKQFGVTICVDEATARAVRAHLPASEARTRHLARVFPKGMDTAINVYTLYPGDSVETAAIETHEAAVADLIGGRWRAAREKLQQMPLMDGPAQFLRDFLARSGESPPSNWDGTIRLESK
jgi:adenylate cyclase